MQIASGHKKMKAILLALKMRMYLSLGFGYSQLFPARDVLFIQADNKARRRITFIQRLPSRIVILTTVGLFFSFFVSENEVGLIAVLFLLPSVAIPIAALLGAFMTTRIGSIEVRLRRDYARLRADFAADLPDSGPAASGTDSAERMRDYRAS